MSISHRDRAAGVRRVAHRTRTSWCATLTILAAWAVVASSAGAQGTWTARRLDRLSALARLDGAVHYFHPDAATRATAWDSAFAARALAIADAPTTAAYRRELRVLVAALDDAGTRVVSEAPNAWAAETLADGVVRVRVASAARTGRDDGASLARLVSGASLVSIDLRGDAPPLPAELAAALTSAEIAAPAQRHLRYVGLPDTLFNTRFGYHRIWEAQPGERFGAAAAGTRAPAVAFIVDRSTTLPPLALALRRLGRGAVIGVATGRVLPVADGYAVDMGERVRVDVRVAQRMVDTADAGLPVDTVVADGETALAAATPWATRAVAPWPEAAAPSSADTDVVRILVAPTSGPSSVSHPSAGYRVLAAARLWSTMHHFFPYKAEMGESWDAAFRVALPRIAGARDSLEYAKAVAALAAHLHDSHVRVYGRVLWRDFYGDVPAAALVRIVEGRVVVNRLLDDAAARAGLRVGDVITSVDGEPTAKRIARLSPYFVSSTPQALRARLADFLLAGGDSTPARLTVEDARGRTRALRIPRSASYPPPSYGINRDGPVVRLLPGNVGYVDLERLTVPMVDSTLAALAGTRGIVFDGRGYPSSPAWVLIAARLNPRSDSTTAARVEQLVVVSPDSARTTVQAFAQPIRVAEGARYAGRTALLIDERAISQAEHLGLWFEAANGTIFVGSPTMGANGPVTSVQLPGGLRVSFTGARILHADGRPLQRIGLVPDVRAAATVAGIRAGRDEVLERAVACILDTTCSRLAERAGKAVGPAR